MEYQRIINFQTIHQINQLNLEEKIGFEQTMNHVENAIQCKCNQIKFKNSILAYVYMIIVMHIYFLKEL